MSQDPIIDYWGTGISVDLVYKSAGAFVYLELDGEETEDFARLTPEQAVQLARPLRAHLSATLGEREPDEDTLILNAKEVAALHDLFGRVLASMQPEQPSVEQGVVEIRVSLDGAKSFVSDSSGWGAMGTQEITEALLDALRAAGHEPPFTPATKGTDHEQ